MTAPLNLIVPVRHDGDRLRRFMTSLDQQILPAAEWQVTLVLAGVAPATAARLATWQNHRPNINTIELPAGTTVADQIDAALEQSESEWVMIARSDLVVTRAGLQRLLDSARSTNPDVVVGRAVRRNEFAVDDVLFDNGPADASAE